MIIRNLWVRIRSEGLWRTLGQVKSILIPTVFGIWTREFESRPLPSDGNGHIETRVGVAAIQELSRLRKQRTNLPVEFYRDVGEEVQTCAFAKLDERLAAIAWGYDSKRPGHFLRMCHGDAEIRSVYTLTEFRGRGIAKAIVREAFNWFWEHGADRIYAVIHRDNIPSIRAFESLGFVKVGELKRPALFGPRYISADHRAETWTEALRGAFRRQPMESGARLPWKHRAKQIRIRLCDNSEEWDRILLALQGSLHQSWMWGELRRAQGWIPWRIALEVQGNIVGLFQVLERRLGPLPWKIMYAPGGVSKSKDGVNVYREMEEFFQHFLRARRSIVLRADPLIDDSDLAGKEDMQGAGFRLIPDESTPWWNLPRTNMIVDINCPDDQLLRRMRQKHREHIRRAGRSGLVLEKGTSIAQLNDFYGLLVRTGYRQRFPVRSFDHFLRLRETLLNGSGGLVFLARFKEQAIAAIICVRFASTCYYLYGGFDWNFRLSHPNEVLHWEAIKWAKTLGCTTYNMLAAGTSYPPREGSRGYPLYHYKKGFGAELYFYAGYFDMVGDELKYRIFRFLERNATGNASRLFIGLLAATRRITNVFHKRRDEPKIEVTLQD
jgi:lipid II:glycine glycyltransferase (peptidoglycan interpeptide bridge formation enzyme)/RimJ/RimL family protein N-acetyltransferase